MCVRTQQHQKRVEVAVVLLKKATRIVTNLLKIRYL